MERPKDFSVTLHFLDGSADGMLVAKMSNNIIYILKTPRTEIAKALQHQLASYFGVYLLFGEDEDSPTMYVGLGESIKTRISRHDLEKDWWDTAVLISTVDNSLDAGDIKYLETCLIREASSVKRYSLDNENRPNHRINSHEKRSRLESFLFDIYTMLPTIQIDAFVENTRPALISPNSTDLRAVAGVETFELHSKKFNIRATAQLQNGELVVLAGSLARKNWESSDVNHTYARLRHDLIQQQILQDAGTHFVFQQNYAFRKPSAAAAVILGRPTNGTTDWKLQPRNITYKQWEAEQIAASEVK